MKTPVHALFRTVSPRYTLTWQPMSVEQAKMMLACQPEGEIKYEVEWLYTLTEEELNKLNQKEST